MVASDGGIFAFGDAEFLGSMAADSWLGRSCRSAEPNRMAGVERVHGC